MRHVLRWALRLGLLAIGSNITAVAFSKEQLATYFVAPASEGTMRALADRFEVLRRQDGGFVIVVPVDRTQELFATYPLAQLLESDMHQEVRAARFAGQDVQTMERRLREVAARYPEKARLETYGTSTGGRPEYFLTIAGNAAQPDLRKPAVMITSATHGDELSTVDVSLGLIEKLLAGYGTDPRLTRMVDDHVIYWLPALCIDGYASRSRYVEGRDPNRDFAWPENPNKTPATGCTRDVVRFFNERPNIVGTLDIHAAASMVMFPWAYTYDHIDADDFEAMDRLTASMAEDNGFQHGTIAETIYIAPGSSADYYYWKRKTVSLAVEVSRRFVLSDAEVTDVVTENTESTWRFIEHFQPESNH